MGYRNAGRFFVPTAVKQTIKRIEMSETVKDKLNLVVAGHALNQETSASSLLHSLLHTWNLPKEIKDQCSIYELRAMYASQIAENLKHHTGFIGFKGKSFVPVYQNCSRMDIGIQSSCATPDAYKYYISFRQYGALQFALIQPEYI